ncbi:AAA family ATPase [Kribbella sp. DT2]|uniref:AAA family ATPase n=1 Tax=Kribbella sp. DT2 TaxID=3393427 RepID=UPI003CE950E4
MPHPTVITFTGLPATGKSTAADRLARDLSTPAFSGDWLLGALKPHGVLTGLDRPTLLAMYYDLLTTLITRQLMLGQSAIVDCLINDEIATRWQSLATEHDAHFLAVECILPDEPEHRRRLATRARAIPGWHEVPWSHVARMRAEYPPLTVPHLPLNALNPIEDNLALVHQALTD